MPNIYTYFRAARGLPKVGISRVNPSNYANIYTYFRVARVYPSNYAKYVYIFSSSSRNTWVLLEFIQVIMPNIYTYFRVTRVYQPCIHIFV